jgi:putative flippase GtrA
MALRWLKHLRSLASGQFAVFCGIGVLNTLIDLGVYQLLLSAGLAWGLASALGYAAGLLNSYFLNRRLTFRATAGGHSLSQAARFVLVNVVALSVKLGGQYAIQRWLGLGERVAVFPALAMSLSVNFLGNKLWTFREKRKAPSPAPPAEYD